jgi:hypothetical protein
MTDIALRLLAVASAATISVQPIADGNTLEPSVENEVAHALSAIPAGAADLPQAAYARTFAATNDVFSTNGLNATEIAIKIVSMQNSEGKWIVGTNDFTVVAADILKQL